MRNNENDAFPNNTQVTVKIGNRIETARVINSESQTFCEVDFGDGTFSSDMLPEDILDHECTPKPGSPVRVKWDDNTTYSCTFLGSYQTYVYTLELLNTSSSSRKPKLLKKSHKELILLMKSKQNYLNVQVESPKSPIKRRYSCQPSPSCEKQTLAPDSPTPASSLPLSKSTYSIRKRIKKSTFTESRSERHSNDENESKSDRMSTDETNNNVIIRDTSIRVVEPSSSASDGGLKTVVSPLRRSTRLTSGIAHRDMTDSGKRLRYQQQLLEINDNKQTS